MTIVNRRNALIGFLTLKAGKVIARRKAKRVRGRLPGLGNRKTG
jgi:hypothetical protein